ncbi:hypothetical protein V6N11_077697 [Hibiscus sabdariffa]|uniref:Uncharacterized protein n=1 Tax=Hibiscus sabdariffa TaxID=183260 RepID=A0ABR2TER1_9ROSI
MGEDHDLDQGERLEASEGSEGSSSMQNQNCHPMITRSKRGNGLSSVLTAAVCSRRPCLMLRVPLSLDVGPTSPSHQSQCCHVVTP